MSAAVANFHFIRPVWLLLLPLVVGVWWLWQRRSDPLRGWREQIAPKLLAALVVGRDAKKRGPVIGLLVAWLLSVIAVAGPTWQLEPSPFSDDATPLMIVLKAGISMETADPAPSRLERARLKIADFAAARKGQPLGLIVYAGSAHLVLPPTRDTAVVAQMAAEISPEIMPLQGDRLDLALREAGRVLEQGAQAGSIVVLADAIATDPGELQALQNEVRFPIQFLAINTPDTAADDSLRAVARALGAVVEALSADDSDVVAITRRAASAPLAQLGEEGGQWQEAGYWMLPLVALILLMSFRSEETGKLVSFAGKKSALAVMSIVLCTLILPLRVQAGPDSWKSLWLTADQKGQQHFRRGDFAQAAQVFDDPVWQGVAWYRAGEFAKAAQSFAKFDTADANFNQGNAWLMQGKYITAIEWYDRALDRRPNWKEAADNRSLAAARAQMVEQKGGDIGDQLQGADEIVFNRSADDGGKDTEVDGGGNALTEQQIQALWLRRVQTRPADFLQAKFSYQLAQQAEGAE